MSCPLCLSPLSQDHWDHVQSVNMTRGGWVHVTGEVAGRLVPPCPGSSQDCP